MYSECVVKRFFPCFTSPTHLLIPVEYLPQVVNVQLWLHILPTVVSNVGDLKEMVPHQIERFFDLGDGRALGLVAMRTPPPTAPASLLLLIWLWRGERVDYNYMNKSTCANTQKYMHIVHCTCATFYSCVL